MQSCPKCGYAPPELEPKLFSFNNPHSACKACEGLGSRSVLDPDLIVESPEHSLRKGAIKGWNEKNPYLFSMIESLAEHYQIDLDAPFSNLSKKHKNIIFYGSGDKKIKITYHTENGEPIENYKPFEGVIINLQRRLAETSSHYVREEIMRYMSVNLCDHCNGDRLSPDSLAVKVGGAGIHEISKLPLDELDVFFKNLQLDKTKAAISERIIREITERVNFLISVGLEYLSLGRTACTLSGERRKEFGWQARLARGLPE